MSTSSAPKPSKLIDVDAIARTCPEVDREALEAHLARLDEEYLAHFDADDIAAHVMQLAKLSKDQPVEVIVTEEDSRGVSCTVLAFDHPFEFSLITGLLSGTGFRIDRGDVFTLGKGRSPRGGRKSSPRRDPRQRRKTTIERNGLRQPVIIDTFTGQLEPGIAFESWANRFTYSLHEVILLLEQGDEKAIERAKHHVNELVTDRLAKTRSPAPSLMTPIRFQIEQVGGDRTRLKIDGQDTPAFLYSLSTALSLHKLSIQRVNIRSEGDQVSDEIDVVDAKGKPIVDAKLLEQVELSVLMTKQFTYFLDRSPNPFTALTRFERLCEDITHQPQRGQWIEMLSNPRAMEDLAKILGTSDYLWEDFIRVQYESLLPIFTSHTEGRTFIHNPETLPLRMEKMLEGASDFDERKKRLNKFKDEEIFLIDLDHILNPGVDFRELATRLTLLAEELVAAAARIVYEKLERQYGAPKDERGKVVPYAVFGLGKLGGVALGYASDIELLFIHGDAGDTTGVAGGAIAATEFYEKLAQDTALFIETKREGIFTVDLRLRPYGKESPLAASFNHFESYYGPKGPSHPFERLALVRLRWIAGNAELGTKVENSRNAFVYERGDFDLDALWEIWAKQRKQRLGGGKHNAKYSPGALVDLESTLQLLQVLNAQAVRQLRTPRISGVIEALRRARVVTAEEYGDLIGAYRFLRRTINGLRMLRGNAQDLFLPPEKSSEMLHLARRMGYTPSPDADPGEQLFTEFIRRTQAVRRFVEKHFGRKAPNGK
jgi:glutamate-ammonia-ligase adenylyltransferase